MATAAVVDYGQLVETRCWRCSLTYGLSAHFFNERKKDGKGFFCPMGHEAAFSEDTTEKRLARATAALDQERAAKRDAEVRANNAEGNAIMEREKRLRLKRRIKVGVCPVKDCHRTVSQMARHMKTKHPHYAEKGKK